MTANQGTIRKRSAARRVASLFLCLVVALAGLADLHCHAAHAGHTAHEIGQEHGHHDHSGGAHHHDHNDAVDPAVGGAVDAPDLIVHVPDQFPVDANDDGCGVHLCLMAIMFVPDDVAGLPRLVPRQIVGDAPAVSHQTLALYRPPIRIL